MLMSKKVNCRREQIDLHLVFLSAKREVEKKRRQNSITINEASANFVFLCVFHILVCR